MGKKFPISNFYFTFLETFEEQMKRAMQYKDDISKQLQVVRGKVLSPNLEIKVIWHTSPLELLYSEITEVLLCVYEGLNRVIHSQNSVTEVDINVASDSSILLFRRPQLLVHAGFFANNLLNLFVFVQTQIRYVQSSTRREKSEYLCKTDWTVCQPK